MRGAILVVLGHGELGSSLEIKAKLEILEIEEDITRFDGLEIPIRPAVGTIGGAPEDRDCPTGVSVRRGGNSDIAELGAGAKPYLPVRAEGTLLAMGDVHAVRADGEL